MSLRYFRLSSRCCCVFRGVKKIQFHADIRQMFRLQCEREGCLWRRGLEGTVIQPI